MWIARSGRCYESEARRRYVTRLRRLRGALGSMECSPNPVSRPYARVGDSNMSEHHGTCHCRRIRVTLRGEPVDALECDVLSAGAPPGCGTIVIPTRPLKKRWRVVPAGRSRTRPLALPDLCLYHALNSGRSRLPRMGVNLRMFEPDLWRDLPRQLVEGANF
jgi:hypothetical protein